MLRNRQGCPSALTVLKRRTVRRYKMQALKETEKQFSVFEISLFTKGSLIFLGNTILFIQSPP